ncbi:Phosphoribosylformylglycinamidine cyclo-ligase [bioreactor metagenome]|uniref:phosphoribosylformylglycinamidine cyclo-ligase n=1 Tax=bioreactor metagenome TaxID=1076179 RepID=A0A645IPD1_9ZZZZ
MTPPKLYVKSALAAVEAGGVRSIAHITGGGFYENIPRALPEGLCAKIERKAVRVLPIFDLIAKTGNIPERDMFNTFNMGVGMLMVADKTKADGILAALKAAGESAYVIGELAEGEKGVALW